ncbi:hypothetical protein AM501_22400 [Aneurinibacillus migulanus]|uniref:UPF0178 protein AF333_07960 n=1 Tax=Aneurinibacillus migulanus TaxID=47500 RepID=A0A0D1XX34_ANEMI|nr:YaiI/YqxD family protein [Aneurinibacillus migulanus]KIV55222.1 hypothetical protein TS64_13320 [Aneurinibacillus migulanus]KIV56668.1 hypothetical protein TS65_12740 [Aneurinibacillus migulanus]KON95431.1 hypothetical protein AF333_07960 [Aneurinibacillus migulanus]KPD06001.1 hypothetical protein AM501_22400 [Aneurinibacillus migulanus]MCP1355967.1 YaiI/YqxD family protein [Aneurinibacillus migulanus]
MNKNKPEIWVDADACPVKSIILEEAKRCEVLVNYVASYNHRLSLSHPLARSITVDAGYQSADMYIANHIRARDIVITDDYGLACLALGKECLALGTRGKEYTKDTISFLLMDRHISQQAAKAGGKRKGPRPLSNEEIDHFRQKLRKLLCNLEGN